MKFTAKVVDMARAYYNRLVKAEYREQKRKNPSLSNPENLEKAKQTVTKRLKQKIKSAGRTGVSILVGAALGLLVIGNPIIANLNNSTVPVSYLSESQQYEIDTLSDQDLQSFLDFEVNAKQPSHLQGLTTNEKFAEITAKTDEAYDAFMKYQNDLKIFMQAYDQHPDRFSEETWLRALQSSNALLGTYMKYNTVAQMYGHNASIGETGSRIYNIPDPSDVNFFITASGGNYIRGLAITDGPDGDMINKGYIYTSKGVFRHRMDKAIDAWCDNYDFIKDEQARLDKDPSASSKSHIQAMIKKILDNNDVIEMVLGSKLIYKESWTGIHSIEFEDRQQEQTRNYNSGKTYEDDGPDL